MDMAELASRTGVPVRKLRYVFDHRVLPGSRVPSPGQGIPRTFTPFEGFALALAAQLLGAGLTRPLVAACMDRACQRPGGHRAAPPLHHAYHASAGQMRVGDGRYLRLRAAPRPGVVGALDTEWLPLGGDDPVPDGYAPAVLICAEFGTLAETVRRR